MTSSLIPPSQRIHVGEIPTAPPAPKSLQIALDFDATYTAAPELWDIFLTSARALGHDVRIVTARDERYDRTAPLELLEHSGVEVIYCRGIAKRFFCEHFTDFLPDIWVDDKPEAIGANSPAHPDALTEWRRNRLF